MLAREEKSKIIAGLQRDEKDTGSPEVQVGIMTRRITDLTKHLQLHKKDQHSRRGLLQLVGKRRKLLTYLRRKNAETYQSLVQKLNIRK